MALSPWYALAFVLLLIGGLGTAAFSNIADDLDTHRSTTGGAIARDGDRDHVHRYRPGGCRDDRHPLGTSRTSEGDPYHGRPGALRIESRLEETDQSVRRPIVMTPTICMLEGNNPACHSQRHCPTRPGNPGRLHKKRLAGLLAAHQTALWRSDAVPCGGNSTRTRPVGRSATPGAFRRIFCCRKHTRADRANVVSEGG